MFLKGGGVSAIELVNAEKALWCVITMKPLLTMDHIGACTSLHVHPLYIEVGCKFVHISDTDSSTYEDCSDLQNILSSAA